MSKQSMNPAVGDNSPSPTPWRHGRSVYRTIYDANEKLIGVMDTPEDAALVIRAVNTYGKPR